jgi:DNA-binding transcriptional MerR regulator
VTQEKPFFNLKAVVQQTGLKPDTLRAWERRYGLPAPERSAGGHRLYSQHDISLIKWLMARQREGLSIKRAVDLWRQIEAEGRDPLRAPTPIASPSTRVPSQRPSGSTIDELRHDWVEACLAFKELEAEQAINQAFALYTPETVSVELLQKAMAEIGQGWYEGNVTVQQEHFCSELALRRLEAQVMAAPPPTRPGRILVACPPEEHHVFGLLLLTLLLRRRGWAVVYLGANVPVARLETTVEATSPQMVILAAQQLHSAASLLEAAQALQDLEVPLAYGGLIFNLQPALQEQIPGHFLGQELASAAEAVERLMTAPRPLPKGTTVPERYHQAREHFGERQGIIESLVTHELASQQVGKQYLNMATHELGTNIDAALALGSMEYLGGDIEWLRGLIQSHGIPAEALEAYLRVYYRAAREQLDDRGKPIIDWLSKVLDEQA